MKQLPIIVLPGILCTEAMFSHQIAVLGQHCDDLTVVQFTREKTLSQMLSKVIESARNRPCAMIGFSMGGIVAIELAKTNPELISKLALINSSCYADLPERKAVRKTQISQAKSGDLERLVREEYLPIYLHQTDVEIQNLIVDMALSLGADCFEAQAMAMENRLNTIEVLKQLVAKTIVIGGLQDRINSSEHQIEMHRAVAGSELVLLDECGHFAPLEQPEKVNSALTQWYLDD
jgi:pimeloyl-ACP methyl ester carboxylesterase